MKELMKITIVLIVSGLFLVLYIPQCVRVVEENMKKEDEKFVEDIGKMIKPYYAFRDAITALCEDTKEDKDSFIQKLTTLIKEYETWKEENKDLRQTTYVDLIEVFDSALFAAIYDIRRSLQTDSNPITKDKKTIAITMMMSKVNQKKLDYYIRSLEEQEKETNEKEKL